MVASGTSLTELFGIGPIIAAILIGYTGDIGRFANRDHYAAFNGAAPAEFSCGGRTVHRLSQRGNRQLNHAFHLTAICQIRQPHSDGVEWLALMADPLLAQSAVDRLQSAAYDLVLEGDSYRHRQKPVTNPEHPDNTADPDPPPHRPASSRRRR